MKNEIAFPKNMNFTGGLTKREWYAAMAMQGLHQNQAFAPNDNFDHTMIAKLAVISADALIAELERKEE